MLRDPIRVELANLVIRNAAIAVDDLAIDKIVGVTNKDLLSTRHKGSYFAIAAN